MKVQSVCVMLAVILTISLASHSTLSGGKQTAKIEEPTEVLRKIMEIPEKGIPPSLLRNAHGIAVIPAVIKAGLVVGGRHGWGVLVVRTDEGEWSNPSFVSLTGGSVGYQIGAQSTDIILVFKSSKSVDGIMEGKFTLGADAAIAAGPVGRRAEAATDAQLKAEIYSYSRSRGLFAGISVEGAALRIDRDSNAAFYGREGITASEIFVNRDIEAPQQATKFKQVLTRYAAPVATD